VLHLHVQALRKHTQARHIRARCRRFEAGGAYPLANPNGNVGMGLNAVCLAGVYHALDPGAVDGADMRAARCFMQRQVTFTVNSKCEGGASECKCATSGDEGWSYIVGCACACTSLHAVRGEQDTCTGAQQLALWRTDVLRVSSARSGCPAH
jgi:hypothetical protein